MSKFIQLDTKTILKVCLVIASLFIVVGFLIQAGTGVFVVVAAIFLSVALAPLMRRIDKINRRRSRPGLAAGLTVGLIVIVIGAIVGIAGPMVVRETSKFVAQAPDQIQNAMDNLQWINDVGRNFGIDNLTGQITTLFKATLQNMFGALPQSIFASVGAISGFVTALILVVVLTILFLTQGPTLLDSILNRFASVNEGASKETRRIISKIGAVISNYVTGQLLGAIIDGIFMTLLVFILSFFFDLPSGLAVPMGMIAMMLYMIPMFGPVITTVIISLILLLYSPWAALIFLVAYILFEQVQGNIVSPRIQSSRMALPPLVILISVTLGMYAFGLVGAIVSIPIVGIIKVFIDEYPNIRKLSKEEQS